MRLNKYVAQATGLSRRAADTAINQGRVQINARQASLGDSINPNDQVSLDGNALIPAAKSTLMLNKPVGYVCSRKGQGAKTIYDLLPKKYQQLKAVGRLDKDSSGLLLLTNDGELANQLTHPRYSKTKVYEIQLDKPLAPLHQQMITDHGILLDDGLSKLGLEKQDISLLNWRVTMSEGRNRQIRRTFDAVGYEVTDLHRISFGKYKLGNLQKGGFISVATEV